MTSKGKGCGATAALCFLLLLAAMAPTSCARKKSTEQVPLVSAESAARLVVEGPMDQVGFARPIKLTARVDGASNPHEWTFRWTQVWGSDPQKLVVSGPTLELTTPPPPPPKDVGDYSGRVVPITARAAGRMVFRVEAASGFTTLETSVEITPAFPSAAWPRAPVGIDAYVAILRPEEQEALSRSGLRILPSPAPYLARVLADTPRWYNVRHPDLEGWDLRSGTWLGSKDCGRAECHPNEYARWQQTRHGSVFTRGIQGRLNRSRGPYERHCASCHTVGDQVGANNDGFDERVAKTGWKFPDHPSEAAWRDVPESVRERANVQCENCHGAGWFYVGYGDDVCGQCHDLPPQYAIYGQARRNRMSVSHESVRGRGANEVCAQCHVASEYLASVRGYHSRSKPNRELETHPRGIGCPVCHDPHGTPCNKQLRLCGFLEVPGTTFDAGQGALCVSCHNGEANVVHGPLLRPFIPGGDTRAGHGHGSSEPPPPPDPDAAPHAPQLQVLTGRGGRFLALPKSFARSPEYPHMGVPDSCVGCHYDRDSRHDEGRGHTFRLIANPGIQEPVSCARKMSFAEEREAPLPPSCVRCHGPGGGLNRVARGDYDGNGKVGGIADEVDGLLSLLREEIERQLSEMAIRDPNGVVAATFAIVDERMVLASADCRPLRSRTGPPIPLPSEDPLLSKAIYNFVLVARDGSGGIHNPQYVARLLQNTIEELERKRGVEPRHGWKRVQ